MGYKKMSTDIEKALEDAVCMCGITQLKPKQKEAMLSFLIGKDVFVTLPQVMESPSSMDYYLLYLIL